MECLTLRHTIAHYRLESILGSGGMGMVYLAQDVRLNRSVAIKVLAPDRLDSRSRDRLRTQSRRLSTLSHANLATLFDFGREGTVDYLVMEYVPGTTLTGVISSGPLPGERLVALGVQLAQGLAVAHAANVIHGGVKPGNLRVTPDGLLKILDFGVAMSPSVLDWVGTTGTDVQVFRALADTYRYVAPERLRGRAADTRSDIFSAGVVLYEMACGRPPFGQDHPIRLIEAILNGRFPPPAALNSALDPALEVVIMRALALDPANRYRDGGELAAALEPLRTGLRGRGRKGRGRAMESLGRLARRIWDAASSVTVHFGPDSRGLAAVEIPDHPVERV